MKKKYYYVAVDPEVVCEDCIETAINTAHIVIVEEIDKDSFHEKCDCEKESE